MAPSTEPAGEPGESETYEELEHEEPELGAPSLAAALEALLLIADEPVPVEVLAAAVRAPVTTVEETIAALVADYAAQGRGFDLRDAGGGWRFYTRDDCAGVVERFVRDGQQARLSQAALETLAVIAYRQPVGRARVSAIRGVSVDGVVRTLSNRGLIEEVGTDPSSGATLYGTTSYFLERLGLRDRSELPPIAPLLPGIDALDEFAEND